MMPRQKCPRCGDWPSCPNDEMGWCHQCQREQADRDWADHGDVTDFVCVTRHDKDERL